MSAIQVSKENFQEIVLNAEKKVLLDFWAPWCGPCRMVLPVVEEIAAERPDYLVGKINVDEEFELAREFGIVSIPTLIILNNGEVARKVVGYRPKPEILALL